MELEPLNTFRQGSNQVYLLRHEGRSLLVKRYLRDQPAARCRNERQTLQLWASLNFPVPKVWDLTVPEFSSTPHLVLDYLGRLTLQEWLQLPERTCGAKLELVERIFGANLRRHLAALERSEPKLIHADPNTSNILCHEDHFYFIDFEETTETRDLQEAIAIEVGKFCRWAVRDAGIEQIAGVMRILVNVYGQHRELLQPIIDRTCRRPFQMLHRWRDRRRKALDPREVTKYDLADALREAI
jgi:tRNA A-37 threonylcarbamoyl transferase component Bud32